MKKFVSACIFILATAMTGNAISFAASPKASKAVKTVPAKAPSGKITPAQTKAQTVRKPVQNKAASAAPARAAMKAPQAPKSTAITGKPGSARANAKTASVKATPVNKRGPVPARKKAPTPQTAKTIKSAHRHVKRPAPVITEPPPPPDYIYQAYAVADAATGAILEGENIDMLWPPASVTKIMLSCIILEKVYRGELRLNERVYVSKAAAEIGGTQVYLKAGESFTLEEMMRAIMIQSANDAAHAVAEHVAGNADAFVRLMNRKAAQLGMNNTVFGCVHGLPPVNGRRENLTTCRDLLRLAREALRYPKLRDWTSVSRSTFRRGTTHIHSKNKLLETMPGIVDGLKTGFYRKAGYNIVATGRYGGKRILVVVLGSPTGPIRNEFAQRKLCQYLGLHQEL
ncbi:MAG: serine hydrolase [Deltaproteobacteria bacterium]|nr:serine hydrolase [Deltaproteobacteria bacterium]